MLPPIRMDKMFLFLKLYLVAEILLDVLGAVMADHFGDLADMSHFTMVDTIRISLWRADLVLEIDLREIFEAIAATCSLIHFPNSSLPEPLQKHLHELCEFDVHNWHTFHDFLTGSGEQRRPRFLLATLLSSVVMGVGGYIFGSSHSTSQSDTQLLANQEHFV